MKVRSTVLILLGLLLAAGVWFYWPRAIAPVAEKSAAPASLAAAPAVAPPPVTNAPAAEAAGLPSAASTNRLAFRLTNTPRTIGELTGDRHALLLENAFIDTTAAAASLKIPSHLRASGEPGAYLVQSRGVIDGAFRAAIAGVGGKIVSYIPNNAFLVQVSSAGAAVLREQARVQAVLPYEPYYKVQASLLGLAVHQKPLPAGMYLTLGIFAGGAESTVAQIQRLGAEILAEDRTPFGSLVRVRPPTDWIALANLPGVQLVEPTHLRVKANDLTRVIMGVSTNSTNAFNYLNLYGSNVLVEVNDTGIDPTHPDLAAGITGGLTRVHGDFTNSLYDTDGHGTHVAGIIAGNGARSSTINATTGPQRPSGSVTNANFRGKAPLASLYSVGFLGYDFFATSDSYLQEAPARTNALISNNSWINDGDNAYDLSAASYDAAVRDALPQTTGPQPVLFVFAAGNEGGGSDDGSGGSSDSILSPATAKNVITVGAMEEFRSITNTYRPLGSTNEVAAWTGLTDSSFQVAAYSSRGNVGVQTEGTYGRFKPDVIAPGTFTVSLRSSDWDEKAYYNPTNYHDNNLPNRVVNTNTLVPGLITVPQNAVGVSIRAYANSKSPTPFPGMPIYVSTSGTPNPAVPASYDILRTNLVSVPPDAGGAITDISSLLNGTFDYAIGDGTNRLVNFSIFERVITTNDLGNQLEVLSNLNNSIGGDPNSLVPPHYYRYETGTSMAAPAVSGVLALMQDFFTNTLKLTPSPALLKAMLVNGARVQGSYRFAVTNAINYQGWGLVKLTNSIPLALTNTAPPGSNGVPLFFADQSPTNALATGDRRTYLVTVPSAAARSQPLRVTLAWTDPPGNPAAAIKLVNDLDLIVTNLDNGRVYYANNFAASGNPPFSLASTSNSIVALDAINNVENVFISPTLSTNYSITVVGRAVNVNAVTLEQTNIVQDFALVIASGDGQNTNGVAVALAPPGTVPAITPRVTFLSATNGIYFNQLAGANAPWLSTNDLAFGTNSFFETNSVFHIGQTNQWHFYVVTNTTTFTNAAFIVFLPNTLAIPRLGVFADSTENSTRPEADLELLVASAPDVDAGTLTNFNPVVISNCLFHANGDSSSIGRGGTEFVAYTNSAFGQIYYIGVQCQDQMAGQYGFIPIFSQEPFSTTDTNGNVYVTGLQLSSFIPDGNNAHPGVNYVFGLALTPIDLRNVIVTNTFSHQNFGDLIGALSHDGGYAVLNNHAGFGVVDPSQQFIYDDSGQGNVLNAVHTDGPGSLTTFRRKEGIGPWLMTQIDDSQSQTGSVTGFSLKLEPHRDLRKQPYITVTVPPGGWFYDFIEVPVGYTNLLVVATNLPPTSVPPIELYLNYNDTPTRSNFLSHVDLTNGVPPGNQISYGPPLAPGTYFVGLFNPDNVPHDVLIGAILSFNASAVTTLNFRSTGPLALRDDAVTYDSMFVTNTAPVQNFAVGLRVDHERISDLVFHLINPDGTRFLLMENRGGQSTNGAGTTTIVTNIVNVTAGGGSQAETNYIDVGMTSGTFPITYNFYTAPDEMTVYYGTNINVANLIYDTGLVSNPPGGPGGPPTNTLPVTINVTFPPPTATASSTFLTIVMNQYGPSPRRTAWDYTAGGVLTNYNYLTFTEDTNQTVTPIKFAAPPFVPYALTNVTYQTNVTFTTNSIVVFTNNFEAPAAGEYLTNSTVDGWTVASNQVSVVDDAGNALGGSKFLALAGGSISRTLATIPGGSNTLTFIYRGPGAVSFWRGDNSVSDSISGNNCVLMNGAAYGAGEVGNAFNLDGVNDFVLVNPVNSNLDVGLGGGFAIEAWVYPTDLSINRPVTEFERDLGTGLGSNVAGDFYVSLNGNPGMMYANIVDTAGGSHSMNSPAGQVTVNAWQHVALTYNKLTGVGTLYRNGAVAAQQNLGVFTPQTSFTNFLIGARTTFGSVANPSDVFAGKIDELSIYKRDLSPSEIKAIYKAGTAGKYDSLPQNLAKVNLSQGGVSASVFFGANTNWQTNTITFVATAGSTLLQLDGLQPGMLLDSFALTSFTAITNIVTNTVVTTHGLYYQPEQSFEPILSTIPYGEWQLEVLDNRAGATNRASLASWQLGFTFANTNLVLPPVLPQLTNLTIIETTLMTVTNTATNANPNLRMTYVLVGPTNAVISTNGIITWTPTEAQGPSTNIFVTTVSDNSIPVNSSQNFFTVIVLESNLPPVITFPTTNNVIRILESALFLTNAVATDPDIPTNSLTFALVGTLNVSGPSVNSGLTLGADGTISWTPDETNGPSTNIIIFSVTDTNLDTVINPPSFTVTNRFTLIVLESNLPPVLFLPPNTNILEQVPWSAQATATDPDVPTNTLTFALVSGPAGLTVSPGGVINWTPDELQGPGDYTVTVRVRDNGVPPLSTTNSFTIHVDEVNLSPFFPLGSPTNYFVLFPAVFVVTNSASDLDFPTNTLTYQLVSGPTGAAMIDTARGIVSWPSTNGVGGSNYVFVVSVTDTNVAALTNQSFTTTFSYVVTVIATNTAPFWTNPIANVVWDELTTNNIFVTALDTDLPPNNLTYTLLNAPTNMTVTSAGNSGVITWIPSEAQGPGVYSNILVVVSDNVIPTALTATNAPFSVTVNEVNLAPYWATNVPGQTNFVVNELTLLTVTNTASDDDLPVNPLSYVLTVISMDTNAPAVTNAFINPTNGIITWVPTEDQGPGDYLFTTIVTDTNPPAVNFTSLSATNTFTVTVNETNTAPFWTNGYPAVVMDELTVTNVSGLALDRDIPTNILSYSLTNSPVWASINATSGVITLAPLEADGPTNVVITAVVTDNGVPALSALTNFTVVVNEVNLAPFWVTNTPTNYIVVMPGVFVLTNAATDTDLPTNVLTYLLLDAPTNAVVNTNTGVITWATTNGMVGSNYLFTVTVTDTNPPAVNQKSFSATNSFTLTVVATNTAPFWTNTIPDVAWDELTTNNIFVTALDTDTPPNNLTYTLLNAPAGMTVTSGGNSGVITWIPSEAQGPGVYSNILVVVSDNVFPTALTATNAPFSVTVNEVNLAPMLFLPAVTNINELVPWAMQAIAVDTDLPTNVLTFALVSATNTAGLPVIGLTVTTNGLISWTPAETNGPSTNIVSISVTDTNVDALVNQSFSVTNSFIIVVREVNSAPQFLLTPPDLVISCGTLVVVTNTATDTDSPTNTLVYRLLNPPLGATIDTNSGVIKWTPTSAQDGTTNRFTTIVTDNGVPPLSATNFFTVIVALPTNPFAIASLVQTNILGTNGFLLTWLAPSNYTFRVQWTPELAPQTWTTFTNVVAYNTNVFTSPTNTQFNFFDDGSQTGGFGPTRFYRLELADVCADTSNTPPVLPPSAMRFVTPLSLFTMTNAATDADVPTQTLTYWFTNTVAGLNVPVLNTNSGVITWTPTLAQAGTTNLLTTIVTDSGTPGLSTSNVLTVVVFPIPAFSSVLALTNGVSLQWTGLTNEQFQVQWATNLVAPISWTLFPDILTSTNGMFSFTDTNAPLQLKFYELLLLP